MPRLRFKVPKYRKHRASGQAIVTLGGIDHYLGPHGTKASKTLYDRLIAEYLASNRMPTGVTGQVNGDQVAAEPTVVEILAAFWTYCKGYYRKNGRPTNEQDAFRLVIRDIRDLYAEIPASDFGPKALKAVRQKWIDRGQCRSTINKNMRRLTRIFKWAVSEELIPATVHQALATVPGLKRGRCDVPEAEPILPVELTVVEKTMKFMSPVVRDMVRIQLLTGMRPGEVCLMRICDVDRTQDIWEYCPMEHKTEHHSRKRIVFIGPEAQGILSRYMSTGGEAFCFSPQEAMSHFWEEKRKKRTTPLSCGNRPGTNRKLCPKKKPRVRYSPDSYRRAIHRACDCAFSLPEELARKPKESKQQWLERLTANQKLAVEKWRSDNRWSPNQLRHTAATKIRKQFGLEGAQVILGHAMAEVTQVYAERDADKARDIARRIG